MTMTPKNPPARMLYEQMLLWGWKTLKHGNTGDVMGWPPSHFTVTVLPPDSHMHNSVQTTKSVIRITTDGDARAFWDRAEKVTDKWLEQERLLRLPNAARRTSSEPELTVTVKTDARPAHLATPEAIERSKANRGMTDRVETYLASADKPPTTIDDIMMGVGASRSSVQNALHALVYSRKKVVRVETGVYQHVVGYRRDQRAAAKEAIRKVAEEAVEAEAAAEPKKPSILTLGPPDASRTFHYDRASVTTKPATVVAPAQDIDETIDTVLELLLPGGFKARDMAVIRGYVAQVGYTNLSVRLMAADGRIDIPAIMDAAVAIELHPSYESMMEKLARTFGDESADDVDLDPRAEA